MATIRVKAVTSGSYGGTYRDVDDVFDIDSAFYSDSTVSFVPVGNPDYPLYGWMLQVPNTTPLYSWALSNGGASSPTDPKRRLVV